MPTPDYFAVSGDNVASIDKAVKVLREHGLISLVEARDLGLQLAFGPGYNRAARDNVDRALWALLRQGDKTTAQHWATQALKALRH